MMRKEINKNVSEDVSGKELKKCSTNSACMGLLFILLVALIVSVPKLAVIVCVIGGIVSMGLSVILGIRAKK